MPEPITRAQIKAIHTLRRQAMDEDTYRDLLSSRFNVCSTTELTKRQAGRLIDSLSGEAKARNRASGKQITLLRAILDGCGLSESAQLTWLERHHGGRRLAAFWDLSSREAARAIQAAKLYYQSVNGRKFKLTSPAPAARPLQRGEAMLPSPQNGEGPRSGRER